ncbi:YigZ family protein [Anaerotignum sp. MSJ-24]|uniref:YigZ family protein n=1 Tax=Anaerotignum sp. MSJ-24 TaxID=2841521 RepID=UPI001C112AEA|nr:YigZ family protein [Anaerotignum sp. MSJ-24]MBU5463793.1 YigZ family protein [Anaerotignum sp. MSJ-24]
MLDEYNTILDRAEAELVEKKSRFIATVSPAKTEEEARAFIAGMKKKYWDARHNVFAYQIGERNEIQRSSDDGEPQGTAGKPVLDVLIGGDIKNTVIVVTRYFGGILLGTGGLVRAYGKSAKLGIEAAGVAKIKHYKECRVLTDYTTAGKIQYEITNGEYILKDTLYSDKVEFIVMLDKDNENNFINAVKELSMGKAEIEITEEIYGAWLNNRMIVM